VCEEARDVGVGKAPALRTAFGVSSLRIFIYRSFANSSDCCSHRLYSSLEARRKEVVLDLSSICLGESRSAARIKMISGQVRTSGEA
jgi:hypothetical protein